MKKFLMLIIVLFLTIIVNGQQAYTYNIKIDSITSINKDAIVWLNGMFTATPQYNDSTKCFEILSNFDISESLFKQKATDKNYNVSIFKKSEIIIKNDDIK